MGERSLSRSALAPVPMLSHVDHKPSPKTQRTAIGTRVTDRESFEYNVDVEHVEDLDEERVDTRVDGRVDERVHNEMEGVESYPGSSTLNISDGMDVDDRDTVPVVSAQLARLTLEDADMDVDAVDAVNTLAVKATRSGITAAEEPVSHPVSDRASSLYLDYD